MQTHFQNGSRQIPFILFYVTYRVEENSYINQTSREDRTRQEIQLQQTDLLLQIYRIHVIAVNCHLILHFLRNLLKE
jgi:hypothetical protein